VNKIPVVIDTNVLISGIFWKGVPHEILKLWFQNHLEVWASEEMVTEYFRIIEKIAKGKTDIVKHWEIFLTESLNICHPIYKTTACRDPKDNMFLECAVSIGASTIISGDDDLLVLNPFESIEILRPADFLNLHSF